LRTTKKKFHREVIGLIPAAGETKRIAPLPCSKELYPLGFEIEKESNLQRPKSACQYLIEGNTQRFRTKIRLISFMPVDHNNL
jgi:glucose-1-phosphate thymidylyltransferase